MTTYLAYSCGKMNQSLAFTDEKYNHLMEANLVKFKLLGESDYEIVNVKTSISTPHKVGKTKTMSHGIGGFNVNSSSYFNFDGVNIFEVLERKGYTFKTVLKLDIIHPELTLIKVDTEEPVATYTMNVKGERQENVSGIGHTQRNIEIKSDLDDLEVLFLGAFALSRVDFSADLL